MIFIDLGKSLLILVDHSLSWLILVDLESHVFAGPLSPGAKSRDISALWHFRNSYLTSEVPHISTRRPQTLEEGIGTLSTKFATQEVQRKKSANGVLYQLSF